MAYNCMNLYEDAFKKNYDWDNYLPKDIYEFHDLIYKEFNSPVPLQMGFLLPFVSALAGPNVKGKWMTTENVINFFSITIAASGSGKSPCRKNLVSDPIRYIIENQKGNVEFPDIEVNKYTRAGIEDKLIQTKGYCIVVSDEGSGFMKDLKNRENKNEADIALLNQLYDGEGDKVTLAQQRQRVIPPNSTSIAIALQPEAFVSGIVNFGYQLWVDNGFCERFMVTAVKPFRYKPSENRRAAAKFKDTFQSNLMGKIALNIFEYHGSGEKMVYVLDDSAQEAYEKIVEKYNDMYNKKFSSSQEGLDSEEKNEISCRTKAPTLIGRLTVILWIYCNAFRCVHHNLPFSIPLQITEEFVKNADKIIKISYMHQETFASAVLSNTGVPSHSICRPKMTDQQKVLSAIVRSQGCAVNVWELTKLLKPLSGEIVKDELQCLQDQNFGLLVHKDEMKKDKERGFSTNSCKTMFFKPAPYHVEPTIFRMLSDRNLNETFYLTQFRKPTGEQYFKIVQRYHPHLADLTESQSGPIETGNNEQPVMEELDGKLKTSLFKTKKQSSQKNEISSQKVKKITSGENVEASTSKQSTDGKKVSKGKSILIVKTKSKQQEEVRVQHSKTTRIEEKSVQQNEANFNMNEFSSDLFTEQSDFSSEGGKEKKKKKVKKMSQKEGLKSDSKGIGKKATNELLKDMSGLSQTDFDNLLEDSSFGSSQSSVVNSNQSKRKIIVSSTSEESSEEIEKVTSKGKATKKYKGKQSKIAKREKENYVPDTYDKEASNKNATGLDTNDKDDMVIPESNYEKSDQSDAGTKQVVEKKRRRRLSLSKRNKNKASTDNDKLRRSQRSQTRTKFF